jgi:DNA polymerase (family 10)
MAQIPLSRWAAAARDAGYAYIGISDHSQSLKIAGGVSEEKLWTQIRKIDRLNEHLNGIRILKSAEVDILVDGTLDYSDELPRRLDYTVCSIHSRFAFGREKQTERVLRAMDNPGTRDGATSLEAAWLRDRHGAYRCPRKAE